MKRLRQSTLLLLLGALPLLTAPSCRPSGSSSSAQTTDSLTADERADFAHAVTFTYAQRITVENEPTYKRVVLFAPDSPDTLARYILYPRGGERPTLPADAYLEVPVRRLACLSTSQVGALPLLDATDRLVGVSDVNYLSGEELHSRVAEGKILVIGQGMSINYEALAALRPDALLVSFFSEDTPASELKKAGVNALLDYEWQEESLLGRAEWLKFIGLLVGKNRQAEAHFQRITTDYQETQELVKQAGDPLPILYGMDYKGAWHLPGEKSYTADLLRSAGLQPSFTPEVVSGKPFPLEQILLLHRNDSLWVCIPPNEVQTIEAFARLNPRYPDFEAVRSGRILAPNKRVNATGGNDYWQTGVYEPNLLVKDLVYLTRPALLPGYSPKYWMALQR